MRFRIRKNEHGSVYTIVVSGEMDDESGWDLLQVPAGTTVTVGLARGVTVALTAIAGD